MVAETAKRLHNDYEVKIFCTDPTGDDVGKHTWNGMEVNVYDAYSNSYCFSPSLYQSLKKETFDLMHIHGFTTFCLLTGIMNSNQKPVILNTYYHPHGSSYLNSLVRKFYDPVFRLLIKRKVDKFITISQAEEELIKCNLKITRDMKIIPPGVNIEEIQRSKPFDFEGNLILYVGRLERYKNVQLIIQAIQKLPLNFHFYIIGNGSYGKELQKIILTSKLEKRIKILHNIPDQEVYQWMKTCDVFITLSDLESFGITVIEALIADKPVIVNNIDSLSEFVNEFDDSVFPIDINHQDVDDIAKCIQKASKTKVKHQTQNYSWDATVHKLKKVYENIR